MELFERYLQAVRKYLPWQRQDDIVAELRANLEAQREEREAALGRPLTEGEMIDWLKELGPPTQMAARYQPPRYLIGPGVFPMYGHILRLAATWATIAYAIATTVRTIVEPHGPEWIAGAILQYPEILLTTAAAVTAVFAVLEFVAERYPEKCPDFLASAPRWSPASLPPLEEEPPRAGKPRSLATAIAELIVGFALLIWLLLIPGYPLLLLGPGAAFLEHSPVRLTPVSITFYWAVVAFNAIQLAWQAYNLFTGHWRIRGTAQNLVTKALGIVPIAILLAAPGHVYIELNPDQAARLPAGFDLAAINRGLLSGLAVLGFITALQLAWALWKASPAARRPPLNAVL